MIACIHGFKCGSGWFKFYGVIPFSATEGSSSGTKVDALVDRQIFCRVNTVFLQNVFKDHFGHTACASAKNSLSFQILPGKVAVIPCNHKVPCTLRQLCKVDHWVVGFAQIRVDRGFRSHKSDIRFTGQNGGHCFVCTKAGHQCQINAFLCEIAFFDRHIHRGIEDGMCYFIQHDFFSGDFFFLPAARQRKCDKCRQQEQTDAPFLFSVHNRILLFLMGNSPLYKV